MKPIKLEQWSTAAYFEEWFQAPEQHGIRLIGVVYGDPRGRPDGRRIMTSQIDSAEGNLVTTESGTVYELGEPSVVFLDWMAEKDIAFDPDNPIKITSEK